MGGIWDRQDRRYIVFDVDGTRQAARQRALPCDMALPPAKRRLDAVCAPGYKGRKRGEVVRTRTTVLQMHTRQWIGTYGGRGNGESRGELGSSLQAITTYLMHFAFPVEMALVRLDGQYGDAAVIAETHSRRWVSGDARKRGSVLGASSDPASPVSSADLKGDCYEHERSGRVV
jgi:hypothetical protein